MAWCGLISYPDGGACKAPLLEKAPAKIRGGTYVETTRTLLAAFLAGWTEVHHYFLKAIFTLFKKSAGLLESAGNQKSNAAKVGRE